MEGMPRWYASGSLRAVETTMRIGHFDRLNDPGLFTGHFDRAQ